VEQGQIKQDDHEQEIHSIRIFTIAINLVLKALAYIVILKDFYQSHPAVSEEFMKQLNRPPDQLIVWAMVVTSLSMGFLITVVMKWSGAKTFVSGLQYGFLIALLFWAQLTSVYMLHLTFFLKPVCLSIMHVV